jgi:hypothetical protein
MDRTPGSPGAAVAAVAAATPLASRTAAAMQSPMEKALGRPSGAYRGLATRSVNMSYGSSSGFDRQQQQQGLAGLTGAAPAAAAGFGFEGSQLPLHLPEGQEAAMPCMDVGYDAAAAAVDMVALARSSRRRSGSFSGPAEGGSSSGGAGGSLARPSSGRSLASRSVGMAGEPSSSWV